MILVECGKGKQCQLGIGAFIYCCQDSWRIHIFLPELMGYELSREG